MLKVILTVGIPASGKSTWAKAEVDKNFETVVRVNRDDLRSMINCYHMDGSTEKLVTATTEYMVKHALKHGKNVILDETNLSPKNFNSMVKIAEELNIDCEVSEKLFYVDLQTALDRNSSRVGYSKIPDMIVRKFWNKSNKEALESYIPKTAVVKKVEKTSKLLKQDASLPKAAIFDLDGTMCEISHRDPYNAISCERDGKNQHVVDFCLDLFKSGVKIFFFSGRQEQFRPQTERWLKANFPHDHELHMRKTNSFTKDAIIKEQMYDDNIRGKYNLVAVVDDRLQVCQMWHKLGLPLFRVGDPDASF